ncbi:PilZ domain-containing protein [Bradyrhizobium jicamae]|uniref:PilZ domain-containing protein n=1 Tax=Bradyrhizobium jicamae TaxID=280332 RepID=A0ABS5FLF7_9BRAD|nr:PilZ domain-containing protein [Bradyrhizobium jicamae]MBR0797628.1 PilZ domain-containing protein [Bradyrhizobium jicamae]MBR0937291.1 PilZ domain-containing protein [Bradyrhizobium jicamae]
MALGSKKRESRKSLRQAGWITLDGGFAARACVVEDISSSGAKITVEDNNTLPARLRLAFSRDARTGRACEVVWRRGKTFGVKFVR